MPSSRFIILLMPMLSRMYRPSSNSRTSNSRDEVTVKKRKNALQGGYKKRTWSVRGEARKVFKNDAMVDRNSFNRKFTSQVDIWGCRSMLI